MCSVSDCRFTYNHEKNWGKQLLCTSKPIIKEEITQNFSSGRLLPVPHKGTTLSRHAQGGLVGFVDMRCNVAGKLKRNWTCICIQPCADTRTLTNVWLWVEQWAYWRHQLGVTRWLYSPNKNYNY